MGQRSVKASHLESPSPFTPDGAKGMGEGGGAPLHAICSALQDALGEGAPVVAESHNHRERIYRLLHPEQLRPTRRRVSALTRS